MYNNFDDLTQLALVTKEATQPIEAPVVMSLTTKQAAVYLGLSASTLNKWRCYGTGPRFLKLGRAVRYRMLDLDVFVKEREAINTIY